MWEEPEKTNKKSSSEYFCIGSWAFWQNLWFWIYSKILSKIRKYSDFVQKRWAAIDTEEENAKQGNRRVILLE
jgi:hypothetical protein